MKTVTIQFDRLARVDGSASFGFGEHAEATASVSGPIEVRLAAEQPSRAAFEVHVRPLSGLSATESKAYAAAITSCLVPSCILTQNPRTLIQLVVQARVDRHKDALLASMINAGTLALMNAGSIPMKGVVCAVSVGKLRSNGELIVSPDDEVDSKGCFAFLFSAGTSSCVWSSWRGGFDEHELVSARDLATNAAGQVWQQMKDRSLS